jgi:hypothetical protein
LLFQQQQINPKRESGENKVKHSVFEVLIKPGKFFQDVMAEKENLTIPAFIVLALGIVSAICAYLIGGLTGKMMAGLIPGMESIITISTIIGALFGIFVFWGIWAGVFYLVSSLFKGKGTFKRSLELVGYGYLPQIFGAILTAIVALQYVPKVIVPQIASTASQDPQVIQEAVNALMHDPAMMEMTQITSIISIVFLLWSANIWIFGMQHARGLSPRDSALCVGIPVVAYILYMVYSMAVM